MFDRDSREYWNKRAATFTRTATRAYEHWLMKLLALDPSDTVLDMGCATGTLAVPLAKRGHHVHACDFAEAMLAILSKRAARDRLPITAHLLAWEDDWEAAELGSTGRLGGPPGPGRGERAAQEGGQPLARGRAVAPLGAVLGGHDRQDGAHQALAQAGQRPFALLLVEGGRRGQVQAELHARVRGVHALAAGARGVGEALPQLARGHDQTPGAAGAGRDAQVVHATSVPPRSPGAGRDAQLVHATSVPPRSRTSSARSGAPEQMHVESRAQSHPGFHVHSACLRCAALRVDVGGVFGVARVLRVIVLERLGCRACASGPVVAHLAPCRGWSCPCCPCRRCATAHRRAVGL